MSVTTLSQYHVDDDHNLKHAPKKRTYIIHMDESNKPTVFNDHLNWYDSSLKSVSDSANMLYTYTHVIHGFSTRLSPKEAELLKKQPGVVSVVPEIRYELHTTGTPEFLGLGNTKAFLSGSDKLSNLVIGVLDTGVWPESQSYHDEGFGPIPSSWKGKCEVGPNFNSSSCNKKLVGARFFYRGYEERTGRRLDENSDSKSPRDEGGHGTHTSTTAAGSAVSGANLFGYASGTASGMAPTARVAAYKVCWNGGCYGSDVIAAVDKAIQDGVHVLSMSFGGAAHEYYADSVAIAAFAAAARGIVVSASAGNGGPRSRSLSNVAPWFITVGAGTIDRDFPGYVRLGNGKLFEGISSLYPGKPLQGEWISIVDGYNASEKTEDGAYCLPGSLVPEKVAGKIVICNRGGNTRAQKSLVVKDSRGAAMIFVNDRRSYKEELVTDADFVPTIALSLKKGDAIRSYLNSVANPIATIVVEGTKLAVQPSPVVATFSSRGPNSVTPEVLKPDVLAPGVNILAAWTGKVGPTGLHSDTRQVSFNIISGTSMSCPHVTGLAALIKSVHPEWSPAAIKSALMTTAYWTYKNGETIQDAVTGNPATPFDYGAGHVDPVAALDPGLVYDLTLQDYIWFLCVSDYTTEQIKTVTNRNVNCKYAKRKYSLQSFNYPSFAVPFEYGADNASTTVKYTRILTNVGAPATYKVVVSQVESVKISVNPESLTFVKANQKLAYTVTFAAGSKPSTTSQFARLEWSDGKHIVGSPIAFTWS
ncbi:Subtilase [Trema orientale]|uniref:Subtilase n=1 Tax=Trema orientale TaxID=63057 RepID=A0A2P5EZY4_TREOI|nr:Subtilase [Trema orientale]